ncbi:MAG: hypothetical protein JRN20_09025 [Nitrososphaerota archaeon]|nr:hypothetical protein [Nitrososphaerota archaeon]
MTGLGLAGFDLYGCNSTVENFARDFLGNSSGTSIEGDGWGAAASYQLQRCTGTAEDIALYHSFTRAFSTNGLYFAGVIPVSTRPSQTSIPSFTFQYAEAASGLMFGGVPFNDLVILSLMCAVYQSNVNGMVLNQPYRGELENTETLPAYGLASWLFQSEMSKATGGYSLTGIIGTNITSIDYSNGTLLIGVVAGGGGTIFVTRGSSSESIPVNGTAMIVHVSSATITQTTYTTTVTAPTVFSTSTVTTTIVSSSIISSNRPTETIIGTSVIVIIALVAVTYSLRRKRA